MKIFLEQTVHNKQLNEEITGQYGNYKEDCFPISSGGCKCIDRNATGDEAVKKYDDGMQCKIPHVCYKLSIDANGSI